MKKVNIDRISLWMTVGCSLCTIWSFEVDVSTRKKNTKRQTAEHSALEEINDRLTKIEQRLNRLIPDD